MVYGRCISLCRQRDETGKATVTSQRGPCLVIRFHPNTTDIALFAHPVIQSSIMIVLGQSLSLCKENPRNPRSTTDFHLLPSYVWDDPRHKSYDFALPPMQLNNPTLPIGLISLRLPSPPCAVVLVSVNQNEAPWFSLHLDGDLSCRSMT